MTPYPPPQPPYPPPPGYPQTYAAQPYYPQPYPGQPYGYFAPAPPQEPDHTSSTFAGVMWILCLVRNLIMLPVIVAGGFFLAFFTFGLGAVIIVFPVLGIVGSVLAMASDFGRKNHALGTVGGVLALAGSSFPGLLFGFGVIGFVLALVGLILHVVGKKEFTAQ
jgi:hypothetical protein